MLTSWQGKSVLITGGSSGLGLAIAHAFAAAGARMAIAARDEQNLAAAAEQLRQHGATVLTIVADITDPAQVERMIAQTVERCGRLDVLVNNAGRSTRGNIIDATPDDFQNLLDLNFLAAVRCTRAAMPHLLAARGHLVNIGSLAAKTASRYVGGYAVTKFALAAYTQQLRLELGPQGLHAMLVCPGPIARDPAEGSRYEEAAAHLPEEAKRPGGGVKVSAIAPEKLAQAIVAACGRRQAELVYPAAARWLFALMQLSPTWGEWLLNRYL